jgi:hypothetical protein
MVRAVGNTLEWPVIRTVVSFLAAVALGSAAAYAQALPAPAPSPTPSAPADPCGSLLSIVTRPTVATSVCTVRAGHELVESGYTNTTTTGPGGGHTVSYPQALVRVGMSGRAELDVTPPSYNRTSAGGGFASGTSDAAFGLKWELGYNARAAWGANVQVSAPTGSAAFSANATQYIGNANWSYTLNSVFSLNGTFGFDSLAAPNAAGLTQRYSAFVPSIDLAAGLPAGSQVSIEYSSFSSAGPGFGAKDLVDFAYQRDIGQHVQFDLEYGFQPNLINGQRMHYVGAGLSLMN